MHLAIAEQVSIDQPPGIRDAYQRLASRLSEHDAVHEIMECLGEVVWESQRLGKPLNNDSYLELIRRRATKTGLLNKGAGWAGWAGLGWLGYLGCLIRLQLTDYLRTAKGVGKEANQADTFSISCLFSCMANAAMIALLRTFAEAGNPRAPRW